MRLDHLGLPDIASRDKFVPFDLNDLDITNNSIRKVLERELRTAGL